MNKYMISLLLFISIVLAALCFLYRGAIKNKIIETKSWIINLIHKEIKILPHSSCTCTRSTLDLRKDDYKKVHIPRLEKMKHLTFIDSEKTKRNLIKTNKLVKVEPKGFTIKHLSHSSEHLTPRGHEVLRELAFRYQGQLKGTKIENSEFRISSLTRTHEQQRKLFKKNKAATPNKSAHSYGQAFDIDYIHTKDCNGSLRTLEKVLSLMQKEGKILLCPETGCIHVTVL